MNAIATDRGGAKTLLDFLLNNFSSLPANDDEFFFLLKRYPKNLNDEMLKEKIIVPSVKLTNPLMRYAYELVQIRELINRFNIDVIIHLGNFISGGGNAFQVVYQRNSLFFSRRFNKELKLRKHYFYLLYYEIQKQIAMQSIKRADLVITPSESYKRQILKNIGKEYSSKIYPIPYGLDYKVFENSKLPPERILNALEELKGYYKILHVGNYNYYKNFSAIIRMATHLKEMMGEKFRIILTSRIGKNIRDYFYDSTDDWNLMKRLGVTKYFVMLGSVDYEWLPYLYKKSDLFIWPSYSESFGFPLIEAKFCNLPIVAADLPVNREVCPEALFFNLEDPISFAKKIYEALNTPLKPARFKPVPHISEHLHTLFKLIRERFKG